MPENNPPVSDRVSAGDLLWTPSPGRVAEANITAFMTWLNRTRGLEFAGYPQLWEWSVTELEGFWQAIWDYNDIITSQPPRAVLGSRQMPGAEWFPGARLNYAENVLKNERPGEIALYYHSESTPVTPLLWDDLAKNVRILATQLRDLGVRPGDRVASCLPNIPQSVVAMLATTSIGAIWTSVSPDFGWRGMLDRFRQLGPKVLICTGGYAYGGKDYDRSGELTQVIAGLEGLEHVIYLPFKDIPAPTAGARDYRDLLDRPPVEAADFEFHHGPFGMPIWILFSSGTTGLPKAITHSHGGILIEQLKLQRLNMDLGPGDVLFFYTTTGWMMWNFLVSALLINVKPLLYDGNPGYPEPDALWRMAADAKVTMFGGSPAYADMLAKRGVVPKDSCDLSALRAVMLAGSPVSPEVYAWFLRNVKRDLWLHVGSGGTDVCSGFTGGSPTLPVYAGEHQHRNLGVAAYAFNETGQPVVNEVGEMVITQPLPSMPVKFWGDDASHTKYKAAYFDDFPGVWRQGDFFRVSERGGCFVLGRSDATLNRFGVRIGTAEIYHVLEGIPEVDDAIVVNLDLPGGQFFMPMFVKLADGLTLDDRVENEIKTRLRKEYTPRHVPDKIIQVPAIPTTLTGKKLEVPVRKILMGVPLENAANTSAMADPSSLDAFLDYARTQKDYLSTNRAPRGLGMESRADKDADKEGFPFPSQITDVPGAENWRSMYPYFTRFQPDDDKRFWFYNSMHFPEPMPAFDTVTAEIPYQAIGANTARVFVFPTTLGIEHRIVNGRVYITANPVLGPAEIERRAQAFGPRAAYYYENWDALYEGWKERLRGLIAEIEAVTVPELPEWEDDSVVFTSRGIAQNHYLREQFQKCITLYSAMWHHHTEMLMLGYGAYVVFFQFCTQAFPEISDQTVARMVAGIDVVMYRPDDELRDLARLAVELGVDGEFGEPAVAEEVLAALRARGDAGQRWLEAFAKARDPWFHVSTGDGFYHHHLSWNDDLTVPFTALAGYVTAVRDGTLHDRPTEELREERERIASGYRGLLASDDEKAAFDQMLGLCRLVFPFVEDHKFYCEHWFTTRFFQKIKAFGALLARFGVIAESGDVFQLHHTEIDQALADVMLAWAAGSPPLGGAHFPPIIAERKRMLKVLRDWSPPPALGPVPEALNDPAVRMLWGVTAERIESWLHPSADEVRGVAASAGVVEGVARVLTDVNQIGEIREGEILVCPVTAPSWAPVFGKIKAAVSDIGGSMSHAAIVAREYGMPAVVGTGDATKRIRTGERIRVDGDRGTVRVLS
jgi:acetoacetyl-CoA synthase